MKKRNGSKSKKGSVPSKIVWSPKDWNDAAKKFAEIQIRYQQGGKHASFRKVMEEVQATTFPANMHREHLNSFRQCINAFEGMVKNWRELLMAKARDQKNGKVHQAVNGSPMVLTAPQDVIGYEIPNNVILNKNFTAALEKAGFKFVRVTDMIGVNEIVNSPIRKIERITAE